MPRREDRPGHAAARLPNELGEPGRVGELRVKEELGGEVERLAEDRLERLHPEHDPPVADPGLAERDAGLGEAVEAPGLEVDLGGDLVVPASGETELADHAGVDGDVRKEVGGKRREVEHEIQVHHPVGKHVVRAQRHAAHRIELRRDGVQGSGQVGDAQERDGGDRLGGVGLGLQRGKPLGVGGQPLAVGVGEPCFERLEPGRHRRLLALGVRRVGADGDRGAVTVLQERFADERLEVARTGRRPAPQPGERLFEPHGGFR